MCNQKMQKRDCKHKDLNILACGKPCFSACPEWVPDLIRIHIGNHRHGHSFKPFRQLLRSQAKPGTGNGSPYQGHSAKQQEQPCYRGNRLLLFTALHHHCSRYTADQQAVTAIAKNNSDKYRDKYQEPAGNIRFKIPWHTSQKIRHRINKADKLIIAQFRWRIVFFCRIFCQKPPCILPRHPLEFA